MDIQWVKTGKVVVGDFCSAQGIIQQLGETSVAITTLVIALYTFVVVWWRRGMHAVLVAKIIVALIWIFVILMVIIGNAIHDERSLYQSPTPYWCWIGQDYVAWRIWGEYVWFWITLGCSIIVYIPLFLWSRGNLTMDENSWWRFSIHKSRLTNPSETRRQSYALIAYPLVYSTLILPLSVVRWIAFVQERGGGENRIPSSATFTVISIYGLSGAFNVILFVVTRPESILFRRRKDLAILPESSIHMHKQEPTDISNHGGSNLGRLPSRTSEP